MTEVVTFGCRLNAYESELIRAQAAADGVEDAIVFNTCAVTGEAVRQARQAIRKARRERPGARLIVTGCAAQIDPAAFAAMPEVDLVLGNAEKAAPGALSLTERVRVSDIMSQTEVHAPAIDGLKERARAYVEVQNGCDHRCTFCVIPYGRGNSRSIPAGEVVGQVRKLAAQGFAEVVLTGVDLTSWGADLPGRPSLGQLVARILKLVPELRRLRLSSIDAAEIDPDLMRCLADEERLAPYLHLSLQAGDDMILKRMKRRHLRADALKLVAEVRAARPDIALGADLIAGFPTETGEMFANTLRLVDEADLAFLHVFPFSPRPGTPAARMPPVARAEVKARAAHLRAAGEAALARHLDRQVGRTVSALVEKPGFARAADFTEVVFEGDAPVGQIVEMRVTGHDGRRALSSFPPPGERESLVRMPLEARQRPAARHRQGPQAEGGGEGDPRRPPGHHARQLQRHEKGRAEQRRGDVDLPPQQHRGLLGQHVADDPAEGRGQDPHHHRRDGMHPQRQGLGRAEHRVGRHAQGVEPEQRLQPVSADPEGPDGRGGDQAGDQVVGRPDPEHRRADQEVAQGAAADAGDRREKAEGDDVATPPRGRQRAGRAEHGDGGVVQPREGGGDRLHAATLGAAGRSR